ncbi:MAG: AAA family ATPase [Acholeplasmataceae bacterium]
MLKSLEISNLNSIKEPVIFTMEAEPEVTEYQQNIHDLDQRNRILKVALVHGANASGKRTLIKAIRFVKDVVLGPFSDKDKAQEPAMDVPFSPFAFDQDKDDRTTVSILFAREGIEYWYRLTVVILTGRSARFMIEDEYFALREKDADDFFALFSRDQHGRATGSTLAQVELLKRPLARDVTVLKYLHQNDIDIPDDRIHPIAGSDRLGPIAGLYDEISSLSCIDGSSLSSFYSQKDTIKRIRDHKDYIIRSLGDLGVPVADILIDTNQQGSKGVRFLHRVKGRTYQLDLDQESRGTILLIDLLAVIASQSQKPMILLVDRLDAHLHPRVLSEIIALFHSAQNRQHQLIFTTQDLENLSSDRFRRDQIWFAYRNEALSTELLCLSDIVNYKGERVARGADYAQQYREGKYGADPLIKKGLNWHVD